MKKIYLMVLVFVCFLFSCVKASAADISGYVPHKVTVKFLNNLSSNNPPESFSVVMIKDCVVPNARTVSEGTVLYLELKKVNKEKIGKQDANVLARIVKAYVPNEDKTLDVNAINPNAYVKFSKYEKLDVADKTADVGISVANAFVKNVTYPAHFVKGAVKNESGNRLKSGAQETFDSTVFSYATAGKPLELKNGDLATLTYYTKDVGAKNSSDNSKEENK